MKIKIIDDIRKYLVDEGIYTAKDEISLILLENTYNQYVIAHKDVKKNGQTVEVVDSNKNYKMVVNASFKNYLELQKELFKLIDSLYLSPKSRKTTKQIEKVDNDNPFLKMMNDINNLDEINDVVC